jgi:hypothetical protein
MAGIGRNLRLLGLGCRGGRPSNLGWCSLGRGALVTAAGPSWFAANFGFQGLGAPARRSDGWRRKRDGRFRQVPVAGGRDGVKRMPPRADGQGVIEMAWRLSDLTWLSAVEPKTCGAQQAAKRDESIGSRSGGRVVSVFVAGSGCCLHAAGVAETTPARPGIGRGIHMGPMLAQDALTK